MKRIVLVLLMLFFVVSGCSGFKQVKVPETIQKTDMQENKTDCVEADYKNDGRVFIKVLCPGRVIHVVARLKPQSNYAILIGKNPIVIAKSSPEGIIVFVNQFGDDVEMIPEIPDEELKKIKTNPPAHKATADKPAYAPGASADKGGE